MAGFSDLLSGIIGVVAADRAVRRLKMPTLHDRKIKFRAATQPLGQVLHLKKGARRQFPWWISIQQRRWRLSGVRRAG
jgi:hypothetical protein